MFIINLINNLGLKLVNSINRGLNFPTVENEEPLDFINATNLTTHKPKALYLALAIAPLSQQTQLLIGSLSLLLRKPFYFSIIFLATKQSASLLLILLCFKFTKLVPLHPNLLYIHNFPYPIPLIRYILYVYW